MTITAKSITIFKISETIPNALRFNRIWYDDVIMPLIREKRYNATPNSPKVAPPIIVASEIKKLPLPLMLFFS